MTSGQLALHIIEIVLILGAGFVLFFKSYFSEKGKNLATKEDISEITEKIEKIRMQYAEKLEAISHGNQLRLASLDKRLAVHQEAYTHWRNLIANVHKEDKIHKVVLQCQDWWGANCLYLSPEVRKSFYCALLNAPLHRDILLSRDVELVKKNWTDLISVGELIAESVSLLPINGLETEVPLPKEEKA